MFFDSNLVNVKLFLSCTTSFGVGWILISYLRKLSRDSNKLLKLCCIVFATPVFIYLFLHFAARFNFCDWVVADGFSVGVVIGILSNLSLAPVGKGSVQLVVNQITGKKHSLWLDSKEVLVGEARNAIAESMNIVPASRINIESGRGCFIDDLNAGLLQFLGGSRPLVNFFGFTIISCHISIKDADVQPAPIDEDKMSQRDNSNTHFRSLLSNIKGEARYGHHLTLTAKVATANADVRGLFVSPVEKFAAAAPIHQLAVPAILSSAMYVRLLNWNAVNAAAAPSEAGGSEIGDNNTGRSSASSCAPAPTAALSRSRSIIDTASRIYKGALEPSTESIRNGDLVVIECDGKFMSVTRGWWMAWSSSAPRRSGAFKIEILERNPTQFETSLRNIKDQHENLSPAKDCNLRTGDSFRLRSVKFPEYEMGVTSVKLKDEFCYVGLRKIDNTTHYGKAGEEWCLPVRFSVKVSHLSNKMFKI